MSFPSETQQKRPRGFCRSKHKGFCQQKKWVPELVLAKFYSKTWRVAAVLSGSIIALILIEKSLKSVIRYLNPHDSPLIFLHSMGITLW